MDQESGTGDSISGDENSGHGRSLAGENGGLHFLRLAHSFAEAPWLSQTTHFNGGLRKLEDFTEWVLFIWLKSLKLWIYGLLVWHCDLAWLVVLYMGLHSSLLWLWRTGKERERENDETDVKWVKGVWVKSCELEFGSKEKANFIVTPFYSFNIYKKQVCSNMKWND